MTGNLRQNIVILVIILSFFALSLTASAESAAPPQTSKKPAKTAPAAKKNAKTSAAATPVKKASAKTTPAKKATPAPVKKSATTAAKSKTADKKTNAKDVSKDKNSKNKTTAKAKETPAKKTAVKSARKPNDVKSSRAQASKTDSRAASKNSKPATIAKKNSASSGKTVIKETVLPKTGGTTAAAKTPEKNLADAPQIIVTDVSARIRSQAKPGAPELTQAKLGTIFQVAEKTPAWYRVNFSSSGGASARNMSGWISANSVNDLNSASREQLYRQIAERYYKPEGMDFATASELFEFLARATEQLENAGSSAEIELKKLLALRSALKAMPMAKANESPYRDFLKKHEQSVVYSEPAGEWLVRSSLFWELRKKQEKSPLADQIAWEASQNPLPGECEGYVNCYLFYARMTSGEYLSLHPSGRKNLSALTDLVNTLEPIAASLDEKTIYTGPSDVTDRAEFNNLIAELRTIVSRLPLTEKEKPLQQLKKIAEGFR